MQLPEGAALLYQDASVVVARFHEVFGVGWSAPVSLRALVKVENEIKRVLAAGTGTKFTLLCVLNDAAAEFPGTAVLKQNQDLLRKYKTNTKGVVALFAGKSSVTIGVWRLVNLVTGNNYEMTTNVRAAGLQVVAWNEQINLVSALKLINALATAAPKTNAA